MLTINFDAYRAQAVSDIKEKIDILSSLNDGQQRDVEGFRAMCATGWSVAHNILTESEFTSLFLTAYINNGLLKSKGRGSFIATIKRSLLKSINDKMPPLNGRFKTAIRKDSQIFVNVIEDNEVHQDKPQRFYDKGLINQGFKHVAIYKFYDDEGELAYEKLKYSHPEHKNRFLYRHTGDDGKLYRGKNERPDYPYNLLDLFDNEHLPVIICEGEKDADNAKKLELLAVSVNNWNDCKKWFTGRDVVIVPDNDQVGKDKAHHAQKILTGIAKNICIVHLPGLPDKGDFTDWIESGGNRLEFEVLMRTAQSNFIKNQHSKKPRQPKGEHELRTYPMKARNFLEDQDILYIQGDLYKFSGTHWEPLHEDWLCKMISKYQESINMAPTIKTIKEMKTAILNEIQIEKQPERIPNLLSCHNGVVDLNAGELLPHSPDYMIFSSVDYSYDPHAGEPVEWLKFLNSIWPEPHQKECIQILQRVMGYLLSAETKAQKIFQLVGPPRSGKGTIGRTIGQLIGGSKNTSSPSLQQLQTPFGLQSSIDKKVMLISEANIRGKNVDRGLILDTLLRISGEDEMTISRKNKQDWIGRLTSRILFMTNDPLPLSDGASALLARMIILPTPISFVGREDFDLESLIEKELGAILKWTIEGYRQIKSEGFQFKQPDVAKGFLEEQKENLCPLSIFIDECCELDPEAKIPVQTLYERYRVNCNQRGIRALPRETVGQIFTRDLRGARNYNVEKKRMRDGNSQINYYIGIRLI